MKEHIIFIPGVGGRDWLWKHRVAHLRDIAACEVLVLEPASGVISNGRFPNRPKQFKLSPRSNAFSQRQTPIPNPSPGPHVQAASSLLSNEGKKS